MSRQRSERYVRPSKPQLQKKTPNLRPFGGLKPQSVKGDKATPDQTRLGRNQLKAHHILVIQDMIWHGGWIIQNRRSLAFHPEGGGGQRWCSHLLQYSTFHLTTQRASLVHLKT